MITTKPKEARVREVEVAAVAVKARKGNNRLAVEETNIIT